MPVYEYQCYECGLLFEKNVPRRDRKKEVPCPSCKSGVSQIPPSSLSYSFGMTPTGAEPQNTGVSRFDHSVDRIIGADSARRWETVHHREAHKRSVLAANPGAEKWELSRTPDGDYRVMAERETAATLQARSINTRAISRLRQIKASSR
jgi:putative FmdB family regulatory protein